LIILFLDIRSVPRAVAGVTVDQRRARYRSRY